MTSHLHKAVGDEPLILQRYTTQVNTIYMDKLPSGHFKRRKIQSNLMQGLHFSVYAPLDPPHPP